MSCGTGGSSKKVYTGNQVGDLNYVGDFNFVAGGIGGLSAGLLASVFTPDPHNRRPWLREDAAMNDQLLDAAYPTINLQWFVEIVFSPTVTFRFSDRAFYVQDKEGLSRFYDARVERAPQITSTVGEWLTPNFEIGDVQFVLNNRDGYFNEFLPLGAQYKQWTGSRVTIKIGFGERYENYHTLFEGQVTAKQGLTADRDTIMIKAYDKFDLDEISLPPRVFDSDSYPDIDPNFIGKSIPLIYGDWSEEIPTYGGLNATCLNALEEDPVEYIFKISDVSLRSIDGVFLHRGERAADKPQGPIRIADNVMTVDLDAGQFTIPSSGVILDEPYYIAERIKAGPGTSAQTITSDNGFNFVDNGVKVGDFIVNGAAYNAEVTVENLRFRPTATGTDGNNFSIEYYFLTPDNTMDQDTPIAILVGDAVEVGIPQSIDVDLNVVPGNRTAGAIKQAIYDNPDTAAVVRIDIVGSVPFGYPPNTKPSEVRQTIPAGPEFAVGGLDAIFSAEIIAVANFQIEVDSMISFAPEDEYSISTVQYSFQSADKISVVCQGKQLNLISVDSISDISTAITNPQSVSSAFDSTIWITDDGTQKIYNLSFDGEILDEILYTEIDAAATSFTGIHAHSDNRLWLTSPDQSKIYSYDLATESVAFVLLTSDITGIGGPLASLAGISVQPNGKFWILDNATQEVYLIDAFSGVNPVIDVQFNTDQSNVLATDPTDISYDAQEDNLIYVDRATNSVYRIETTDGDLISQLKFSNVASEIGAVTGVSSVQDGTFIFVDQGVLSIYNYCDLTDLSNNPAAIARDLLSSFAGHTYDEFDLSWMQTTRQLSDLRSRVALTDKTDLVKAINKLLSQYNTVLHFKFQKYALLWLHFDNFRTTGKAVNEKDIVMDSFKPNKEINQYFNSANATINSMPFDSSTDLSDTYISASAISFAGKEYTKTFEMPNVYRRADADVLLPLFVRLGAPEPEFIDVKFGFRIIRSQMQDFLQLTFDESQTKTTPGVVKKSGRRFSNIPTMIRKLTYDLGPMTVQMKLWSLGTTQFGDYTPDGPFVGGEDDEIVLSTLGRQGRISPIGTITASSTNTLTLEDVDGDNAENRTDADGRFAWLEGYKVAIIDGETKEELQILTIDSVSGAVITFEEDITVSVDPTEKNDSGFVVGGHLLQYSNYIDSSAVQKNIYASFGKPIGNYPTTRTLELEQQRAGDHNFADDGQPYVLYPIGFSSEL